MLKWKHRYENPYMVLVETQNDTTALENSVSVPQNLRNIESIGPNNPPPRLRWKSLGVLSCPVHIASQ